MSVVVTVWGGGICVNVCCVAAVVKPFLNLGLLKYVVCLCKGCDGCCIFCLYCDAWICRCSCMGSMSVSSCRCCMFVSCVDHMAVLNTAFCMTPKISAYSWWNCQATHNRLQIEINYYPDSLLFVSAGFLPRVSSQRLN